MFLILFGASQGFDLQCLFKDVSLGGKDLRKCYARNVNVTKPNDIVTSVNGETWRQFDVHSLQIFRQTLNYFPMNIESFFPNLKFLRVKSSKLKTILQIDLKPFEQLEKFDAADNDIDTLASNLFDFNPNLHWIQFYANRLKYVGPKLLSKTKKLQFADFSNNFCVDFDAWGKEDLPFLQAIIENYCAPGQTRTNDLSVQISRANAAKSLEAEKTRVLLEIFGASTKVLTSVIENHEIFDKRHWSFSFELTCWMSGSICNTDQIDAYDDEDSDEEYDDVEFLAISKKPIVFIPSNLGRMFPNVKNLFIKQSGIFIIDSSDFVNMTNLSELVIDTSFLRNIPTEAFKHLQDVFRISLRNNLIENLEPRAFSGLAELSILNLINNSLTTLNANSFEDLEKLAELYLSNNKLKFIDPKITEISSRLQKLSFNGNSCVDMSVPEKSLSDLTKEITKKCVAPIEINCKEVNNISDCIVEDLMIYSRKTNISNVNGNVNNVTSLAVIDQSILFLPKALGSFFPYLLRIRIENSQLSELQENDFIDMTALKSIVILNNNLMSMSSKSFNGLSRLELLDLSSNNIKHLEENVFADLLNLKTLTLSDNDLKQLLLWSFPHSSKAIVNFRANNNKLELIEMGVIKRLRIASVIDLTENDCIDMKFDKLDKSTKSFVQLVTEVEFNCTVW